MKRLFFFIVFSLSLSILTKGQAIPNLDFENWEIKTYPHQYPNHWSIMGFGEETNIVTEKITNDAQDGSLSVKIISSIEDNNGKVIPTLLCYGTFVLDFDMAPIPIRYLGNPLKEVVDKFHFYYKSDIVTGDEAFVFLQFTMEDGEIETIEYPLTESKSSWTHAEIDFNVDLKQVNSVFIAFMSSKHSDLFGGTPKLNNWLKVDNVYFTKGDDPIQVKLQNHSFEDWKNFAAEEPVGWETSNGDLYEFRDGVFDVSKSTDAGSGDYAVKIQGVFGMGESSKGEISYRGPFNYRPSTMFVSYKYLNIEDKKAEINVNLFSEGNSVNSIYVDIDEGTEDYEIMVVDLFGSQPYDELEIRISSAQNFNNILWIDKIFFSHDVPPINLFAEAKPLSKIEVTWEPALTEDKWQIAWGPKDFDIGGSLENFEVIEGAPSFTIEDVERGAQYEIYVRSYKDESEKSAWTGPAMVAIPTSASLPKHKVTTVFPNPSDGNFVVNLDQNYKEIKYFVSDSQGLVVKSGISNNSSSFNVDMGQNKGVFFLKVNYDNKNELIKLIVK